MKLPEVDSVTDAYHLALSQVVAGGTIEWARESSARYPAGADIWHTWFVKGWEACKAQGAAEAQAGEGNR